MTTGIQTDPKNIPFKERNRKQMSVEQIRLADMKTVNCSVQQRHFNCRFWENLWSAHARNFNPGNSWKIISFVSYNLKWHVNTL